MAKTQQAKPSSKAINDAMNTWNNFITISKICGAVASLSLILMAVFLV